MNESIAPDYKWDSADAGHTNAYLCAPLAAELRGRGISRVFDLGCGNGAVARFLSEECGVEVTGVDPSETGIAIAQKVCPHLRLEVGSAYDDLRSRYGTFPAVISLEVIEHVYSPRKLVRCVADLLEPSGVALISTPYHGYWKNLTLALTGRMDRHFTALWDHGHIKFWSVRTITHLLQEAGLCVERVHRLGRVPVLAKSMLIIASKRPE